MHLSTITCVQRINPLRKPGRLHIMSTLSDDPLGRTGSMITAIAFDPSTQRVQGLNGWVYHIADGAADNDSLQALSTLKDTIVDDNIPAWWKEGRPVYPTRGEFREFSDKRDYEIYSVPAPKDDIVLSPISFNCEQLPSTLTLDEWLIKCVEDNDILHGDMHLAANPTPDENNNIKLYASKGLAFRKAEWLSMHSPVPGHCIRLYMSDQQTIMAFGPKTFKSAMAKRALALKDFDVSALIDAMRSESSVAVDFIKTDDGYHAHTFWRYDDIDDVVYADELKL